jgi:hypothetical protein
LPSASALVAVTLNLNPEIVPALNPGIILPINPAMVVLGVNASFENIPNNTPLSNRDVITRF